MRQPIDVNHDFRAFFVDKFSDLFLCSVVLKEMVRATKAASERERTLFAIPASWRVMDLERAVLSVTVADSFSTFVVTPVAEPQLTSMTRE